MATTVVGGLVFGLVVAACGSGPSASSRAWHPPAASDPVHLTIGQSCPASLGEADGVSNRGGDLGRQLVPPGPTGALICRYGQRLGVISGHPARGLLYREVRLDARAAGRLAATVDRVSTAPPSGRAMSCPAALGTATILVFGYRVSSVDLWSADTGCQTLGNGVIGASQTTGGRFSSFVSLVDRLAPRPSSAIG